MQPSIEAVHCTTMYGSHLFLLDLLSLFKLSLTLSSFWKNCGGDDPPPFNYRFPNDCNLSNIQNSWRENKEDAALHPTCCLSITHGLFASLTAWATVLSGNRCKNEISSSAAQWDSGSNFIKQTFSIPICWSWNTEHIWPMYRGEGWQRLEGEKLMASIVTDSGILLGCRMTIIRTSFASWCFMFKCRIISLPLVLPFTQ